jgi:hypothetical protein
MVKRLKGSVPARPKGAPVRAAETELVCYVREGWARAWPRPRPGAIG